MTLHVSDGWRLCKREHANLSGLGAYLYGGRWNSPGRSVNYLSADATLPLLETMANLDIQPGTEPVDWVLMHIDFSVWTGRPREEWVEEADVDPGESERARSFGDSWIDEARTPVLAVPSVIVPESYNLLLNPAHPDVSALPDPTHRPFRYDERLFDFDDDKT